MEKAYATEGPEFEDVEIVMGSFEVAE